VFVRLVQDPNLAVANPPSPYGRPEMGRLSPGRTDKGRFQDPRRHGYQRVFQPIQTLKCWRRFRTILADEWA